MTRARALCWTAGLLAVLHAYFPALLVALMAAGIAARAPRPSALDDVDRLPCIDLRSAGY